MMRLLTVLVLALILPCKLFAGVEIPKRGSVPHPRLIMTREDEQSVKMLIARDRYARIADSAIVDNCARRLTEAVPGNERDASNVRMKNASLIEKDLNLFAYVARIHDDEQCRKRAIDQMMSVCDFPDWSPSHFLDPSQVAFGVSICYDWLYDHLTPKQRKKVKDALLYKAVLPSFESHPNHYFFSPTNWNSVCNCGIVAAAACLMDDYPVYAQKVLERCVAGNRKVLDSYNPIGAFPEGYGYWAFGTNHEAMLISMLETAFGSDFGLKESSPGFMNTSQFILNMNGPFGMGFNYGDNAPQARLHPAVFWFAKESFQPSLLYMERQFLLSDNDITIGAGYALPAMMTWYSGISSSGEELPSNLFYENIDPDIPLFIYRSCWDSPDAAYLGVRGGTVRKVGHSHIDVGSFVYYRDSVRWICDLGKPDYVLAENHLGHKPFFTLTQDSRRWEVLRTGAEGHGIVTFDGERPLVDSYGKFLRTFKTRAQKGVMMDLTEIYSASVSKYLRMVYLDENEGLVVSEKIVASAADRLVRWKLLTEAEPQMQDDGSVVLCKYGKVRTIRMSSEGKTIKLYASEIESDKPWDSKNRGYFCIYAEFLLKGGETVNLVTSLN